MQRRDFFGALGLTAAGALAWPRKVLADSDSAWPIAFEPAFEPPSALPAMTVYKTPTCGCCKDWIKHVQANGFTVKAVDMNDLSQVKHDAGVPADLESCHTALVGTYVVEGHVPADLVKEMLAAKPAIIGLSVPGMVNGPPGMEQSGPKQPYTVVAFAKGGKTSVFAKR